MNKIEEYNAIFGQQQIENINSTISLFSCKNKNEKIETLKKILFKNVFNGVKNITYHITKFR